MELTVITIKNIKTIVTLVRFHSILKQIWKHKCLIRDAENKIMEPLLLIWTYIVFSQLKKIQIKFLIFIFLKFLDC